MITIKSKPEIEILREGGKILAGIMKKLGQMVAPGVTTGDLENAARELAMQAGGRAAQLGFAMPDGKKFPSALCVSINSEIVHAASLPTRRINDGDLVSLDFVLEYPINDKFRVGRIYNQYSKLGGYYTDMAITVPAGMISKEAEELIKVTQECLQIGIKQVQPGKSLYDIGSVIQKYAEDRGFGVIRELVGHGVGYSLHEDPQVPNYAFTKKEMKDVVLETGMILAIEPMICLGNWHIKSVKNSFAFATVDGSLAAHAEHTVAVVDSGRVVLTEE